MAGPFDFLSQTTQWILFACFVAATAIVGQHLKKQGEPLRQAQEHGVLAIEAPWSPGNAAAIIERWRGSLDIARTQVRRDFLFLVLYPVAFALICGLLANMVPGQLSLIGVVIAWGVLAAAPLDAVENAAILKMLSGATHSPFPQIATVAASLKFTLVFGAWGYIVTAGAVLVYGCAKAL